MRSSFGLRRMLELQKEEKIHWEGRLRLAFHDFFSLTPFAESWESSAIEHRVAALGTEDV